MRILIVRHAEPDYSVDSLTEKGWREAGFLAERLKKEKIDAFYVSPLGRAKDTASLTLKDSKAPYEILDWLQEFPTRIVKPNDEGYNSCVWDWLPEDWTKEEIFYDPDHWYDYPLIAEAGGKETYLNIISQFDALLEKYGYHREGKYYTCEENSHDTICLFCHLGLGLVLVSHLLNVSPMVLWQGFCPAPSSVTTIYTEERRKGKAAFRVASLADVSHLYANGEEPSFMARYKECFEDLQDHE